MSIPSPSKGNALQATMVHALIIITGCRHGQCAKWRASLACCAQQQVLYILP